MAALRERPDRDGRPRLVAGLPRRLVFVISICRALTIAGGSGGAMPTWAGHGSWTHHDLHWWESGTSQYGGYADVDASDQYDYGAARFWVTRSGSVIRDRWVGCGPLNEGCNYQKTPNQYWPQYGSTARSAACAYDTYGDHRLTGSGFWYVCSDRGLPPHIHSVSLS